MRWERVVLGGLWVEGVWVEGVWPGGCDLMDLFTVLIALFTGNESP